MSENLVKKPKKDEDEFEDEEEDIELDDDSSSSKRSRTNDDDMKKRLFMLMGIIVGGVLLLLFILFIASIFTSKNYTYDDMEEVMKNAAVSYFKDYPDYLPKNEGDVVEVNVANLVAAGKMKELSEYRSDEVACAGTVQVQKVGDDYLYTPYLNCGEAYYSVEFYNKIATDNPITTSGEGLYSSNNQYAFRGENVNNYVKLDKSLWRIVKINNEGNVVLIHNDGLDFYQPWDDRYNEETQFESGVNSYNVSRIKEYLGNVLVKPNKDNKEDILSNNDKAKLASFQLCVAGRTTSSESKNNTEECRQKAQNQKIGLLTLSEYLYASLDPNCKSAATRSCMNYNYLALDDEWWLATPNSENTYKAFKIDRFGDIKADNASTYSKVRPVIYLNNRVMYAKGKGTKSDPYKVK